MEASRQVAHACWEMPGGYRDRREADGRSDLPGFARTVMLQHRYPGTGSEIARTSGNSDRIRLRRISAR